MLRDATYTGITPALLGLARRGRRRGALAAERADQLRQGPAGPERARLARRVAGALPRRPDRRRLVIETALEVAEARPAAAEADEAEVVVQAERSGPRALRRLGDPPADADRERERAGARRPRRAPRLRVDEPARAGGLCATSPAAGEAADSAPADPDFAGLAGAEPLPRSPGYDEETAALGAEATRRGSRAGDRAAAGELARVRLLHERRHELAVANVARRARAASE